MGCQGKILEARRGSGGTGRERGSVLAKMGGKLPDAAGAKAKAKKKAERALVQQVTSDPKGESQGRNVWKKGGT